MCSYISVWSIVYLNQGHAKCLLTDKRDQLHTFFLYTNRPFGVGEQQKNLSIMKRFFLIFTASAMFASCSTTQVLQTTEYMESSARILDGEQKMLINPIMADLKVSDTKIYHTEAEAFASFPVTQFVVDNYMTTFKAIAVSF